MKKKCFHEENKFLIRGILKKMNDHFKTIYNEVFFKWWLTSVECDTFLFGRTVENWGISSDSVSLSSAYKKQGS